MIMSNSRLDQISTDTLYILSKDLLTMFTYNTIEVKRKCV